MRLAWPVHSTLMFFSLMQLAAPFKDTYLSTSGNETEEQEISAKIDSVIILYVLPRTFNNIQKLSRNIAYQLNTEVSGPYMRG